VTQTLVNITDKFANGYTGYLEIVYQLLSSYCSVPDRQFYYNVILRRVPVRVSAFVNPYVLRIVTVCPKFWLSSMQTACSLLQFVACLVLAYFPLYLIHGTHLGTDLLNTKYMFRCSL